MFRWMCLILEGVLFFSSNAFPLWDRNTGRLLCAGHHSLFSQKDKYYLYFLFFPMHCIVLRAVGTVEGRGRDLAKPRDVMNDFSHPRAWREERPQRVTLLFSDVKKAHHPPSTYISSTGRALPCRIHTGRHSSSMKYFSARTQASCPGKLIFYILAISFMNLLPELWNDMTTNYLSAIEKNIFPDFKSSGQRVLCAFSFPFSFPPLHHHMYTDRQSTFSIPPYIPKEQLKYATCG